MAFQQSAKSLITVNVAHLSLVRVDQAEVLSFKTQTANRSYGRA